MNRSVFVPDQPPVQAQSLAFSRRDQLGDNGGGLRTVRREADIAAFDLGGGSVILVFCAMTGTERDCGDKSEEIFGSDLQCK